MAFYARHRDSANRGWSPTGLGSRVVTRSDHGPTHYESLTTSADVRTLPAGWSFSFPRLGLPFPCRLPPIVSSSHALVLNKRRRRGGGEKSCPVVNVRFFLLFLEITVKVATLWRFLICISRGPRIQSEAVHLNPGLSYLGGILII